LAAILRRANRSLRGGEDIANESATVAAHECHYVRPERTRVLPHEFAWLVENLASEVGDTEYPISTPRWTSERRVTPTRSCNGIHNICTSAAASAYLALEPATRTVANHTEDSSKAARLALHETQCWQLAGSRETAPGAIAIKSLRCVLFGLADEHLAVEELLNAFVAVVDQQLLEPIHRKHLETIDVEQSDELADAFRV
jgi:hypothetical protein